MEQSIKIFVPLGTQKFPFNRLILALNKLVEKGLYKPNEIVMQSSVYEIKPKFLHYETLPLDEFNRFIEISEVIITHSGVNSIITCMNMRKPLIIVPRLKKFGEHVDDHQLEIANLMEKKFGIIIGTDLTNLEEMIEKASNYHYAEWKSNKGMLINQLKSDIEEMLL